jgi:hypothetical protein
MAIINPLLITDALRGKNEAIIFLLLPIISFQREVVFEEIISKTPSLYYSAARL